MRSHFLHLLLYATIVAAFFGTLVRQRSRDQIKLAAVIWLCMVGGALMLAYLMYPFPR